MSAGEPVGRGSGAGAEREPERNSRLASAPAFLVALFGLIAALLLPGYLSRGRRAGPQEPRPAGRIVSLSPSTTETLFALGVGDRVVGVSTWCDYPPEAKALPKMGDYGTPATEAILAARPDLVVVSGRGMQRFLAEVERSGVRVYYAPDDTAANIAEGFAELGRLVGADDAGRRLAGEMRLAFAAGALRPVGTEDGRPTVFLVTQSDPLGTVGGDTFVDELIRAAGGRNVASDLGRGYFTPTVETVIRRDPQVIVVTQMGEEGAAAARALAVRPGWGGVRAVRDGRVWSDLDPDCLLRPGPRLIKGLDELRARLARVRAEA
ncbi:MAG TPA: helical backbone metal receptor, partial [Planctomycetota bacterium]|nr:helical backbone metal receptor [Planctomycetota bacterium]